METVETQCCIVGGGPAGMMLGFLLSRAGVNVAVLEKHGDFLRDFRGDTIHPSTLQLMEELGLLSDFLKRPHQRLDEVRAVIGGKEYRIGDFSHLPVTCKFIALMPQWDFLNFLKEHAGGFKGFHLYMEHEAVEMVEEDGRVVGVKAKTAGGMKEFRAPLTVGCDGRHSTMREEAHLIVEDLGAPIDVFWMRISKRAGDPGQLVGRIDNGHMLVMIDRGDYYQCGFVIPKGAAEEVKAKGLESLQKEIVKLSPFLKERIGELDSWEKIKLLTVAVDRLKKWHRPGLLCIGDAAHAMSPVGGVGINLAIQDAVASANLLAAGIKQGNLTEENLQSVQDRREPAAVKTQRFQVFMHRRFITKVLDPKRDAKIPWIARFLLKFPATRYTMARIVGIGFQPEHIETPEIENGK